MAVYTRQVFAAAGAVAIGYWQLVVIGSCCCVAIVRVVVLVLDVGC
jgi:hypothetical protein